MVPRATIVCILTILALPAYAGYTLDQREERVIANWLKSHPKFRLAADSDCKCDDHLAEMRTGHASGQAPIADYHPFVATGDFNSDGAIDFAVVVKDRTTGHYALLVFNGPFSQSNNRPAFFDELSWLLPDGGLFFPAPLQKASREKPYRLLVGGFHSDNGAMLVPSGRTYKWWGAAVEEHTKRKR